MNNTTSNVTTQGQGDGGCMDVKCGFTTAELTLILTSAFSIALAGIIGNVCTGIVVISSKKFSSISNLSTLNLALADLFLCMYMVFNFIYVYLMNEWVFGEVFCKMYSFLMSTAVSATLLNLLVVSIERFTAVCFPFFLRMRKKFFLYAVPLVWILALGKNAPDLKYMEIQLHNGKLYCFHQPFPDELSAEVYTTFDKVFFYGIMAIMIPIQIITICMLRVKGSAVRDNSHANYIRRRNACYMLMLLMLSCVICWFPIRIFGLVATANNGNDLDLKTTNTLYAVFMELFFSIAVIHPLIFFFISPKGKRTVKTIMKNTKKRISSPQSSKTSDSGRRRTMYWPFSGLSMRSSSVVTKDTAF